MENTDVSVQQEISTSLGEPVIEEISKIAEVTTEVNGERAVTEVPSSDTVENVEQPVVEEVVPSTEEQTSNVDTSLKTTEETPVTETVESNTDEVVPSTSTDDEVVKSIDEQENVTGTVVTVPPTCVSPGRANVPLKEVNESEKEEPTIVTNGTETANSKKRELENEDEQTEGTNPDNDERNGDQVKKIKISEVTDTPTIETKELDTNIIVNGNTAVEV